MRLDQILGKVVSSMTKQFLENFTSTTSSQKRCLVGKENKSYGQIKQLLHSNDFFSLQI